MKEELVNRATTANQEFLDLVAALPDDAANTQRIVGEWTAHDALAHVIAWLNEASRVLTTVRDGTYAKRPLDTDAFNAEAAAQGKNQSWDDLKRELQAAQQGLLQLARSLPDTAWQTRLVGGWIAATTFDHYAEHTPALHTIAR